jgi:hypothetical protein
MQSPKIPSFGDAERMAWGMILHTITEAIDVDGLQPFDRGKLAELHERAAWHIGAPKLVIPPDWISASTSKNISGPGALDELRHLGLDSATLSVLTYTARLHHIDDVERRSDAELLQLHRIGPKRLHTIRSAIKRYRDHS